MDRLILFGEDLEVTSKLRVGGMEIGVCVWGEGLVEVALHAKF